MAQTNVYTQHRVYRNKCHTYNISTKHVTVMQNIDMALSHKHSIA